MSYNKITKNRELAEAYAEGNEEAKLKHFFIEGKAIYSYGYHFPIAFKIGDYTVLFNKDGYSMTTSRHKNLVRRALINYTIIELSTEKLKEAIQEEKQKTHG